MIDQRFPPERGVPERLIPEITAYVDRGHPPRPFLQVVICNDRRKAVELAGDITEAELSAVFDWFATDAPGECRGSQTKMDFWMRGHAQRKADAVAEKQAAFKRKPTLHDPLEAARRSFT